MIEEALRVPGLKVNVLTRPRSGDFLYSEKELRTMMWDIEACRRLGVNGVVFGVLTAEGNVDVVACHHLVEAAADLHKTFHRAFDMVRDPHRAAGEIKALGFDRILTSGHAPSALEGAHTIEGLQDEFPEITFIAAGGVTAANAAEIVGLTGVREIHASAKTIVTSGMHYRNLSVSMGIPGADEFSRTTTSCELVGRIKQTLT